MPRMPRIYFGAVAFFRLFAIMKVDIRREQSRTGAARECMLLDIQGGVFNMAQTTFSVRMEEGLKRQFEGLCQEFGMNMATAIHVFVRAVVRERRIPFEISSLETELTREGAMQAFMTLRQEVKRSGAVDMTLEEINREIEMARQGAGK